MSGQGALCEWIVVVYKDVQLFSPFKRGKVPVEEANEDCVEVNTYIVNFHDLSEDTREKLSSHGIGKKPYLELHDMSPKTVDNVKQIRQMTGGDDDGRKNKKKRQTEIEEINMLQGYKGLSPADDYRSRLELHAALGAAIRNACMGPDTGIMPIVNGTISVVHVCHRWIDDV